MTFPIARLRAGQQKTSLGPAALGMSFADPPPPGGGECTIPYWQPRCRLQQIIEVCPRTKEEIQNRLYGKLKFVNLNG